MKIYIVEESRGQWSGAHSSSLKSFFNKKNADDFIDELLDQRQKTMDLDDYKRFKYLDNMIMGDDEPDDDISEEEYKELEAEHSILWGKYNEFDDFNDYYVEEIEISDYQQFIRENKLNDIL